ncbi:MAG: twin-arginine translocase TatA/TatE family subunit [Polyangiaceae bacterium]
MFGVSLTEFLMIVVVALVVLGPQRLPSMLRTVGHWIYKIRTMTTEVRAQTGIDDLLRKEGFNGGLSELRALLRGDPRPLIGPITDTISATVDDPYVSLPSVDEERERPVEGPDAYGAIPEDLLDTATPTAAKDDTKSDVETRGDGASEGLVTSTVECSENAPREGSSASTNLVSPSSRNDERHE